MSVPLGPHEAPDLGSWRAQAACQLGDHELFFPPEEEQGEYFRLRVSLAKRICASCPGGASVPTTPSPRTNATACGVG
jgi:hypothetical protein